MTDRHIVGDTVRLTNSFYVGTTLTDPTAVSLAITDPSGNTATYTYALAQIVKDSTGVYYRNETVDEDGVWEFVWTGTGTVPDVEAGSLTVWPATVDDIDLLDLAEAKKAVGLEQTNTSHDDYLKTLITAVSSQIDQLCGPVRTRTVTNEVHDGGSSLITLDRRPVYSVTSVSEYTGTSARSLAAETNSAKTGSDYFHDGKAGTLDSGRIVRRGNGADTLFPIGRGNVVVTYVAGRAPNTEVVPARFKQAAAMMLRSSWIGEQASGTQTFQEDASLALLGPKLLNRVAAYLEGEMIDAVAVL